MAQKNVIELNNGNYAVIDLDTGTVLGTNVVLVPMPASEEESEEILSSDSAAESYARQHGIALRAEVPAED